MAGSSSANGRLVSAPCHLPWLDQGSIDALAELLRGMETVTMIAHVGTEIVGRGVALRLPEILG